VSEQCDVSDSVSCDFGHNFLLAPVRVILSGKFIQICC
jgi:hypothetical protein